MKQLTKRILSMLLCAVMLLSMAACGSSAEAEALGAEQVKGDVQEYLTSFVDESATITSLYQSQNNISDTQTEISCQVAYTSDSGDGSGTVTLTYDLTDSGWTLSNCTADLSAGSAAVPAAADGTETENTPSSAAETAPDVAEPAQDTTTENTPAAPASSATGTASTQTGALAGYTLTEVSTFENPAVGSLYSNYGVVYLAGNESVTVYGPNGVVGEYADVDSVRDSDSGYVMVKAPNAADENCMGLITSAGEELLSCEAVWIDTIYGSDRFVEVYYSTGACSESDDYILCLRYTSGESKYYTGYIKVFDLQTKSFVGDIEVHDADSSSISANESMVLVDDGNNRTLYDASGSVIKQSTAYFYLSETLVHFRMDGCTYVLDVNGERWTTVDSLDAIKSTCDYFTVPTDDNYSSYSILDSDGNEVLPGMTFKRVSDFDGSIFSVMNADETAYQLIDIDGNILYEGTEQPYRVSDDVPGWWYVSPSIGAKTLVGMDGTSVQAENGTSNLTPNDSNGNYTVLSTGETLELGSSAGRLTYGMVYARDTSGKYAAYDLFTGNALTETLYSDILYNAGYVYALDGSTWHVFQVNPIYE